MVVAKLVVTNIIIIWGRNGLSIQIRTYDAKDKNSTHNIKVKETYATHTRFVVRYVEECTYVERCVCFVM